MTRKLINDIRENLEAELLKSLNNKNKQSTTVIQKISSNKLDTKRQEKILDKKLEEYRLYELRFEFRTYIKELSKEDLNYYTIKMTYEFLDRIIIKYNERHHFKLTERNK